MMVSPPYIVDAAQATMSSRSDDSANPISPSSIEDVNEGFAVPFAYCEAFISS